jgi:low affinity Fe/Cu permease
MASSKPKSRLEAFGCTVSAWVADVAAHPYVQVGVILVCAAWFAIGLATDLLTAILSIMAITFTQMVLNNQKEREADAHRRDVAMHAKLDELVIALKGARNEMAGIEVLEEEDIRELKEEVREAIEEAGDAAGDRQERDVSKRAAEQAIEDELEHPWTEEAPRRRSRAKVG